MGKTSPDGSIRDPLPLTVRQLRAPSSVHDQDFFTPQDYCKKLSNSLKYSIHIRKCSKQLKRRESPPLPTHLLDLLFFPLCQLAEHFLLLPKGDHNLNIKNR